ncbi:MAG: amino acid racemase [Pyrinomonadaceae bacterium]
MMKTAGIIGGLGPESTIEYYRLIISSYRERTRDGSYPHLIINSLDLNKMINLFGANKLPEVLEYLLGELRRLSAAGADFAAVTANTPHVVFDDLLKQSPIPLISIVEATCEAATARGFKRVGLFGTRFTMQGRFYTEVFEKAGITLVTPAPDEQDYIHDKYMSELVNGVFLPETRDGLLAIAGRLKAQEGIEALILGGTELPLILKEEMGAGIPFLDTTRLHVEQIVSRLLS